MPWFNPRLIGHQPSPGGHQPEPPTTGSGVKPPPPPPDRFWALDGSPKIHHFQAFEPSGDEIFSSYWQPTGRHRIVVGWFGFTRLEQEVVFRHSDDDGRPTCFSWHRAPRGTVIQLAGRRL